jgi:hypothetical protein
MARNVIAELASLEKGAKTICACMNWFRSDISSQADTVLPWLLEGFGVKVQVMRKPFNLLNLASARAISAGVGAMQLYLLIYACFKAHDYYSEIVCEGEGASKVCKNPKWAKVKDRNVV